jgi:hypothetical protein
MAKKRVHLLFDAEFTKRIDDFRYQHRFPTRAAAIKWLLEQALKHLYRPATGTAPALPSD